MSTMNSVQDNGATATADPVPITADTRSSNSGSSPEITLTSTTEYACYSPSSLHHCWAVTSFKAPLYEPSARASVDIVAVIDKSGSMSGQKIALVRETLLFVIDQLKDSDRISLVVYDSCVNLMFELMSMTEENKERARSLITSIITGSSTNLCGGLLKGMRQITLTKKGGARAKVQSVLLLTDGLANKGITDQASIIKQMKLMQTKGLGAIRNTRVLENPMPAMYYSSLAYLWQGPIGKTPIQITGAWPEQQQVQSTTEQKQSASFDEPKQVESSTEQQRDKPMPMRQRAESTATQQQVEPLTEQQEVKATIEKQQVELATEQQQLKASTEQQQVKASTEQQQQVKASTEQQQVKASTEQQQVKASTEQQQVKASTEQQQVKASTEQQQVKASTEQQQVKASTEQQQVKASTEQQQVKASTEQQQVKASTEQQQVKASTEQQQVKASTEQQQVKASTEQQQVKASTEQQQVKASTEQQQVKASTEQQQVKASAEQQQVKASIEQQQVKASAEQQQVNASTEQQQVKPSAEQQQVKPSAEQQQVKASTEQQQVKTSTEQQQVKTSTEQQQVKASTEQQQVKASTEQQQVKTSTEQQQVKASTEQEQIVQEPPKLPPRGQRYDLPHLPRLPSWDPRWSASLPTRQSTQGIAQQRQVSFAQMSFGEAMEDHDTSADNDLKFDATVYTFGFGPDHSAPMLEAISTQGHGMYYYVDNNDKIPECFADCLGGLLSVVGQNLTLKLEANGDCLFKAVHANRPITWIQPRKSCEIAMGDIQSEEGRDLVLELELPPVLSSEHVPLVSVELSYFNVITSQFDTVQCQLTTNRTDGEKGKGNLNVDAQRNRILVAQSLKEAETLASQEKLEEARSSLSRTIASMAVSPSRDDALTQQLIEDSSRSIGTLESQDIFRSHGRHFISSRSQSHSFQRTNYIDGSDRGNSGHYTTCSKVHYKEMARKHCSSSTL